jgi:hypothetical protein
MKVKDDAGGGQLGQKDWQRPFQPLQTRKAAWKELQRELPCRVAVKARVPAEVRQVGGLRGVF